MANHAPQSQTHHEITEHARDYTRFVGMMKWSAIISFVIGLIIIMFVL